MIEKKHQYHTELETPFGVWAVDGNGTVTDTQNRLQWIRAPFGMEFSTYSGDFGGTPEKFTWKEATNKFGRGEASNSGRAVLQARLHQMYHDRSITEGGESVLSSPGILIGVCRPQKS